MVIIKWSYVLNFQCLWSLQAFSTLKGNLQKFPYLDSMWLPSQGWKLCHQELQVPTSCPRRSWSYSLCKYKQNLCNHCRLTMIRNFPTISNLPIQVSLVIRGRYVTTSTETANKEGALFSWKKSFQIIFKANIEFWYIIFEHKYSKLRIKKSASYEGRLYLKAFEWRCNNLYFINRANTRAGLWSTASPTLTMSLDASTWTSPSLSARDTMNFKSTSCWTEIRRTVC